MLAPERYDEMDERRTTERVLKRMTDPEQIEKRRLEREDDEMNNIASQRIGLWVKNLQRRLDKCTGVKYAR